MIADVTTRGIGFAPGTYFVPTAGYACAAEVELKVTQKGRIATIQVVNPPTPPAGALFWYIFIVDGISLGQTRSTQISLHANVDDAREIACYVTLSSDYPASALPALAMPQRKTIHWARSNDVNARSYRVQYATGAGTPGAGDWISFVEVADTGAWLYSALSPRLADLTWHWFRVVPIDAAGNTGTALVIGPEFFIRRPTPPDFALTFNNATQRATFASA